MRSRELRLGLGRPKNTGEVAEGAGMLRALYERLTTQRHRVDVVSLEHEEYEGRNVLSITAWDEHDGLEEVSYYEQPIFARYRADPAKRRAADTRVDPTEVARIRREIEPAPRIAFRRPAGRRLTDTFYRDVADAYRRARAAGLDPRKTMAEDAGCSRATVARWIAESRRRGHLPPAEKKKKMGNVGA